MLALTSTPDNVTVPATARAGALCTS